MSVRPNSAPKSLLQDRSVPCCSCSLKDTSSTKPFCTLHKSWLQLQDSIIEKDHQVNSLCDQVSRLQVYKGESNRKDKLIVSLREEITELNKSMQDKKIRIVTVEDEVVRKEDLLQSKDSEIRKLTEKISMINGQLTASNRTNMSLQSQLAQKTDLLSSHCEELRELKKGRRFIEDGLSSAQEQTREKQATLLSMQERIRRLKSLNEDLKTKLEDSQKACCRLTDSKRSLNQELSQLKHKSNSVSGQLENTQKQLLDTRSVNDDLTARVGSLQEQIDSLCHQLKSLVCLHTSTTPISSSDTSSIVSAVSTIVTEQLRLKEDLKQTTEELEEVNEKYTALNCEVEEVTKCLSMLELPIASSVSMETMISNVHTTLEQLEMETNVAVVKNPLLSLISQLREMKLILNSIQSILLSSSDLQCLEGDEEGTVQLVQKLNARAQEYRKEFQQLEQKLSVMSEQHSMVLQQTLSSIKEDYEKRITQSVEETERLEREKCDKVRLEEKRKLEIEKAVLMEDMKARIESTQKALLDTQTSLQAKEEEVSKMSKEVDKVNELNCELNKELATHKELISSMKNEFSETQIVSESRNKMREQEQQQLIQEYKVQSQEHARTIVALEQKLLSNINEYTELKSSRDLLQVRVSTLEQQLDEHLQESQTRNDKSEEFITLLRRQLTSANERSERERQHAFENEEKIKELEETFGNRIETMSVAHQREVDDLKEKLSQNEMIITDLNKEYNQLKGELKGRDEMMKQKIFELSNEMTSQINKSQVEEVGVTSNSLVSIGQQCLGENHEKVINSQQHAINDLRKKMNDLMISIPPVPSHQSALKELAKLRQEISQMRAEEIIKQETMKQEQLEKNKESEVEMMSSQINSQRMNDLQETLSQSETAYHSLLSLVCDKLSCPLPFSSSQRLVDANKVKREHIIKEREEFANSTLRDCITDLRRRHVKTENETSHLKDETETTGLTETDPDLTEYGVYLNKEQEELDQQKRLHQAISKRQDFKQSQQEMRHRHSHSCLITPEESKHKVDEIQRSYFERLRKKDTEISRLKLDLHNIQLQNNTMSSQIKLLRPKTAS